MAIRPIRLIVGTAALVATAATFGLAADSGWQDMPVIEEVRTWSYTNYTRVVLYTSDRIKYQARELPADSENRKPPRIYLDLQGARIAPSVSDTRDIGDGLLTRARLAQFDKETARLVLDLESIASFQVMPYKDRIVIDVRGRKLAENMIPPDKPQPSVDAKTLEAILGEPSVGKPPDERKTTGPMTIVIDAGHGGKDPGAIGHKGLYEKHVVLDISKRVADLLRSKKFNVVMTRSSDKYLKLDERTAIANGQEADLFISIHANSAPTPKAYGVETYHLAPPSDKRSASVAARENGTSVDETDVLEELLQALRISGKMNPSKFLAKFVQESITDGLSKSYKGYRDLGVKGAPFFVLVGTDMASVLVEVGFVTNPDEARKLNSSSYQARMAEQIVKGVEEYSRKAAKISL